MSARTKFRREMSLDYFKNSSVTRLTHGECNPDLFESFQIPLFPHVAAPESRRYASTMCSESLEFFSVEDSLVTNQTVVIQLPTDGRRRV
jgi:hypothetical protein